MISENIYLLFTSLKFNDQKIRRKKKLHNNDFHFHHTSTKSHSTYSEQFFGYTAYTGTRYHSSLPYDNGPFPGFFFFGTHTSRPPKPRAPPQQWASASDISSTAIWRQWPRARARQNAAALQRPLWRKVTFSWRPRGPYITASRDVLPQNYRKVSRAILWTYCAADGALLCVNMTVFRMGVCAGWRRICHVRMDQIKFLQSLRSLN